MRTSLLALTAALAVLAIAQQIIPSSPKQVEPNQVTRANLKQVSLGMLMYASDYDDVLPRPQDTKSAFAVIFPYVKNLGIYKSTNPGSHIEFNFAIGGVNLGKTKNLESIVLFYDFKAWPDGTHLAAFVDGHVKALDKAAWKTASKTLTAKYKTVAGKLPKDYYKTVAPNVKF